MRTRVVVIFLFWTSVVFAQSDKEQRLEAINEMVQSLPDPQQQADTLIQLANDFYNTDLGIAHDLGQRALQIALEEEYLLGEQGAHDILKRINRRLGNLDLALDHTLKSLQLAEQFKDSASISNSYMTLGNLYSTMGSVEEAHGYLLQSYALGKMIGVKNLSSITNFLGRNYVYKGDFNSAIYYLEEALRLEKTQPQEDYTLSYIYNNLGEAYLIEKRYSESIMYYDSSLALPEDKKSPLGYCFSYLGLAKNYQALKQYDMAVQYVEKCMDISKAFGLRPQTLDALAILYSLYEETGRIKEALATYKVYNAYGDSLLSDEKIKAIENLSISYQTDKFKAEAEFLKREQEFAEKRTNMFLVFSGVLLLSLLALVLVLWRSTYQRKKSNALLKHFNEELMRKVEERTENLSTVNAELLHQNNQLQQFSYIASHNLRSPVARILGLINILMHDQRLKGYHEEMNLLHKSGQELDESIRDLNSMIDIKISESKNLEWVSVAELFNKVQNQFSDTLEEIKAQVSIIDELKSPIYTKRAFLESILNNLLSNAIKYRSADRLLHISISLKTLSNGILIRFVDNGLGMELEKLKEKLFNPYQRFHPHIEGKGIGLYLVKSQVESLQGTIQVDSTPNEGTVFEITLPSIKEKKA
ncbi:tetratricopeptide repeat protein [Cytophagales bacterium LB-30]|uniref:histidine kinase n=1 Tax=Shiella aurantiaca TaxID=3058365 RepID=A0ABT8F8F0_9BACT|nr:tetratricopeptide repeat protein [Shiella aurantiaca]MDN4166725.1 tetratricopeptide repeat protein [Shiella aurantiaca]